MTTDEKPEIISLCFGDIQIYIPESIEAINRARRLLDMLEEQLNPLCCPYTIPQDERHAHIQKGIYPPTFLLNGQLVHTAAHGAIDTQIEAKPTTAGENTVLIHQDGKVAENPPERIPGASENVNFYIPKFAWDKTKEKSYRTIFFFEHEDDKRVMILYINSRIFTTKEAVLTIPHPTPYNYAPLRAIQNNKRTALRFYREYLAKNGEQGAKAQAHEGVRAAIEEKDKGIFEDIQLYNDENKDEDEIMGEAAKEAEEKRLGKLKKTAKVNSGRWKDRVENEASARTKELRKTFALKATMGI